MDFVCTGANNLSGFKAFGSGYRDNGNNGSSGYSSLKTGVSVFCNLVFDYPKLHKK